MTFTFYYSDDVFSFEFQPDRLQSLHLKDHLKEYINNLGAITELRICMQENLEVLRVKYFKNGESCEWETGRNVEKHCKAFDRICRLKTRCKVLFELRTPVAAV